MSKKISRSLDLSRASITMTYDPEAANDECVFIDHTGPLFLTLDDAHKLYATYADFFAMCREQPRRPTHAGMQAFVNRVQADPTDSPSTIP